MDSDRIWFIADLHFADIKAWDNNYNPKEHERFVSWQERDTTLIKNWQALVKPSDKIYVLGDVGFDNRIMNDALSVLPGRKRLILGNHDHIERWKGLHYFEKIFLSKDFGDFVVSHYPLHESMLRFRAQFCVHGHTHAKHLKDIRYMNICVEHTDYKPLSMTQIHATIKDRQFEATRKNDDDATTTDSAPSNRPCFIRPDVKSKNDRHSRNVS